MPDTPTDQPLHHKRGSGYPHRDAWNRADNQFRRQVARLARNRDPETAAKAGQIVARAVELLEELTAQARRAEEASALERERTERARQRLARQVRCAQREGRQLSPQMLELVNGGAGPEWGGTPDDAA